MQITTNGDRVINSAAISGDPALSILADDVVFINLGGGLVNSTGAYAIQITGARNRVVNDAGAFISASAFAAQAAILGSAFDDTIENAGIIQGAVHLGSGADRMALNGGAVSGLIDLGADDDILVADGGTVSGGLDFGSGNDTLAVSNVSSFVTGTIFGGIGIDTLIFDILPINNFVTQDFERLEVSLNAFQTWNTTLVGDFTEISLKGTGAAATANFLDTQLVNAAVTLDAASLVLGYNSVVKSVSGTDREESVWFGSAPAYPLPTGRITDFVDLGGGNDQIWFLTASANIAAPAAPVRGGTGLDTINFASTVNAQLDLGSFSEFETLTIGQGLSAPSTYNVLHIRDVTTIRVSGNTPGGPPTTAIIRASILPDTVVVASGLTTVEVAADTVIGKIIDASAQPNMPFIDASQTVSVTGFVAGDIDLRGDNDIVQNGGTIGGAVLLGAGADRYLESALVATVGGIVDGGAGDDRFDLLSVRSGGAVRFDGGSGIDIISFLNGIAGVSLDLAAGRATTEAMTVEILNFERALGTQWNDSLAGTANADLLSGSGGDDTIDGGGGDDQLFGDDGTDLLNGDAGADFIAGGAGNDELRGDDGDDILNGDVGNDLIFGGAGNDMLTGGAGADVLIGGGGSDIFKGTRAELAGDTLKDFGRGDRIFISDATIANFTFQLSGNVLTFGTGESVVLSDGVGRLQVREAAGGGIELLSIVRGDLNGDGYADILWRNDDGTLTNWLGQANGGFTGNDTFGRNAGISTSWKVAGFADISGDGRSDILWRNDSGALTDWLGQANGGYIANDTNALIYNIPTSWKVAGLADFNGDGRADILWRNDEGALTDWLGEANGRFVANDANALIYGIPTSWKVTGVGDFDGDGRSDILWRNDNGALTDWLGQANGGFVANDAAALIYNIPTSWKVAGVGDFNGDGRSDILWRNDGGALTNWLGQVNGGFAANDANALIYDIPTSWKVAGVADFNGDGRGDILWRNDNGALTDWLGQANGGFAANDAVALDYGISKSWHTQLQAFQIV
jgi:Ca2+-binding RTX toxin-like protein